MPTVDVLTASFVADLRCTGEEGQRLARFARDRLAIFGGSTEDSDEDLVVRLRSPEGFGAFAGGFLEDEGLAVGTRTAMAWRAFDLLTIPRREDEAFSVEARAPRNLLAFARHLIRVDAFTPLHLLHLVYAVFLDRGLISAVDGDVRADVLLHVASTAFPEDRASALYVSLHLSALEEAEAVQMLRAVLEASTVRWPFKRLVAKVAAPDVRGVAAWVRLAQDEGLLPMTLDPQDPSLHANLPRMHASFAELVASWTE